MVQQHTAAKQVNVKRRSVIVKAVVVIQVEVVVVVWWRRPPWPSWSFGTKMKKNKKRRPTKAKGGSTVWKYLISHEMLDVENSMNFHSMWGRPLQAFFVSSFFFCFFQKGRGDEKGPSSAPPSRSNAQCSCKLKHYTHANIVSRLIRPQSAVRNWRTSELSRNLIGDLMTDTTTSIYMIMIRSVASF